MNYMVVMKIEQVPAEQARCEQVLREPAVWELVRKELGTNSR